MGEGLWAFLTRPWPLAPDIHRTENWSGKIAEAGLYW